MAISIPNLLVMALLLAVWIGAYEVAHWLRGRAGAELQVPAWPRLVTVAVVAVLFVTRATSFPVALALGCVPVAIGQI